MERNEVRREQYRSKVLRQETKTRLEEKGITHYTGQAAEVAYFAGREAFDLSRFEPVVDRAEGVSLPGIDTSMLRPNSKPEAGGLWTSPGVVSEDGSVATRWSEHGDRGYGRVHEETTPLVVKKDALIVRIDSSEDVEKLAGEFPGNDGMFSYAKMAEAGIDGVHLSQTGLAAAKSFRNDAINAFDIWDIESTVWINKDNLISRKPVKVSENQVIDDEDDDTWWGEELSYEEVIAKMQAAGMLDPVEIPPSRES